MEQELPVPREDLITKKEVKNTDANKVFRLPDLNEFVANVGKNPEKNEQEQKKVDDQVVKIDRSNREDYLRALELNPFADADDNMFLDEVCI